MGEEHKGSETLRLPTVPPQFARRYSDTGNKSTLPYEISVCKIWQLFLIMKFLSVTMKIRASKFAEVVIEVSIREKILFASKL